MKKYLFVFAAVLLAGCASNVPEAVRLDIGEPISVQQAQQQGESLRGKRVRWGGEILAVYNHPQFSDVVVLRRELFNEGEPKPSGGEARRFIARFSGFIDPAEFAAQQRLTVVGKLDGSELLSVGEYDYVHPVVRVEQSYRWAKFEPVREPPWYRDPFYCDPFFPWGYRYRHPFCW
jgi:outer membrane lipoprotein